MFLHHSPVNITYIYVIWTYYLMMMQLVFVVFELIFVDRGRTVVCRFVHLLLACEASNSIMNKNILGSRDASKFCNFFYSIDTKRKLPMFVIETFWQLFDTLYRNKLMTNYQWVSFMNAIRTIHVILCMTNLHNIANNKPISFSLFVYSLI